MQEVRWYIKAQKSVYEFLDETPVYDVPITDVVKFLEERRDKINVDSILRWKFLFDSQPNQVLYNFTKQLDLKRKREQEYEQKQERKRERDER